MQRKSGIFFTNIVPRLLIISCMLMLLVSLFVFMASAQDTNTDNKINTGNKISSSLTSRIAEVSPSEKLKVVIVLQNQHTDFFTDNGKAKIAKEQAEIIKILKDGEISGKVSKIKSMRIVNAIAAEATADVINSIAGRAEVSSIEIDEVFSLPESTEPSLLSNLDNTATTVVWGVDKVGAPAVWQEGITGKGIVVAVVDTGIDATHPDLATLPDKKTKKVVGWIDYVNGLSFPYDDHWHGTHVSGTISGIGTKGLQTGVAPGTKLIVAKVLDQSGSGYGSDIIRAFEWAVDNKANVISLSAGGDHWAPMTIAINNIVAAGVIPVIAAGNGGGSGASTIGCPGDEIKSTTVGATDSYDVIATFSSHGPVNLLGAQYIKPDISAPGVSVISTYLGDRYARASGTSMATPHVSGTVALVLENKKSLTPSQINQILENTAVDLGTTGKDNDYGAGRIDAYKAVMSTK